MTLTAPPTLRDHFEELRSRLDLLEARRETSVSSDDGSSSSTAPALIFAKQMYGETNDPGDGSPVSPWTSNFGGIFDPGSTDPANDDCCFMVFNWYPFNDLDFQERTGVILDWITDAEGGFGAGAWGWVEQGQYHTTDVPDPGDGTGVSYVFYELFCFDPARGAGAYADIFLRAVASDFTDEGGGSVETLLDADLFAQGFAESRLWCLAGRDFSGGGSGVPAVQTGVQLRMNYIRDGDGGAHQTSSVVAIAQHYHEPELAYGGSFIVARDDSGVDWWHGGIRGPVLTDRSTTDRYRITVASGVVGTEAA